MRKFIALTIGIVTVWMAVAVNGSPMAPPQAAGQTAGQAQIEKGRVAVTQVCVGCHGGGVMRMLDVRQKTAQEWRETVYRMIGRGAQIFPDEIEPITAYLVSSTGKKPSAATAANQGGPSDARTILERRCQQCHDIARATTIPASSDWRTTLDRMVTLGASITSAEQQTLLEYLSGLSR
jgi:mono/diheme cytochrome c family protein